MRLLIATDSFMPRWDGISRFLNEIIPRLNDDFEISVACPAFDGILPYYNGVSVVRFPVSGLKVADYFFPMPSYRQVKGLVKKADVVFTQTIGPVGLMARFAARRQKKPLVAYIHSVEWELFSKALPSRFFLDKLVNRLTRFYARFFYNAYDLLLVPSKEIAELLRWSGISAPKEIVHLGTDSAKFSPPKDKNKAKEDVGISPNARVVGFCGRIGKEKDLPTLYRAFTRLQKKYDNAVLLIVGQDLSGVTSQFSGHRNVIVVGATDNVVPYLQALDVYVLPSLTETTSLSTLEAMSCGCAVVATKVGYVKEYIKEGHNGLFFPKTNSFALYRRLDKVFSEPKLMKHLGGNARKTIVERFSWDRTVDGMKKALVAFNMHGA